MKIHPQIITKNKIPEFIVLPYEEYKNLLEALENREDIEAIKTFQSSPEDTIPFEVLQKVAQGENIIKKLRESRNLSSSQLAKATGVSRQYISQLENCTHKRKGSLETLKKIAKVLNVNIELLI